MNRRLVLTVSLSAAGSLLLGCGGAGARNATSASENPGKYEQTWDVAYNETSCDQFLHDMTVHEQFVTAADMIRRAATSDDLPPDVMVNEVARRLGAACNTFQPSRLTDAAIGIFTVDASLYTY
jgi:hypothetical protein